MMIPKKRKRKKVSTNLGISGVQKFEYGPSRISFLIFYSNFISPNKI